MAAAGLVMANFVRANEGDTRNATNDQTQATEIVENFLNDVHRLDNIRLVKTSLFVPYASGHGCDFETEITRLEISRTIRTTTSIQERRAFFGCDMNTFWAENRVNREFYNPLITSDMLRVFMGSTRTILDGRGRPSHNVARASPPAHGTG